jgi:hypothetical protein
MSTKNSNQNREEVNTGVDDDPIISFINKIEEYIGSINYENKIIQIVLLISIVYIVSKIITIFKVNFTYSL